MSNSNILHIIPCSGSKQAHGKCYTNDFNSTINYRKQNILKLRQELLSQITSNPRKEKAEINSQIRTGSDFGGTDNSALYLPAYQRYIGNLYSVPHLQENIVKSTAEPSHHRIVILSAMYGFLHPFELIQNYDLAMENPFAKSIWSDNLHTFLTDIINQYQTNQINLYAGHTTAYRKVFTSALRNIAEIPLFLKEVYAYTIINGCITSTPTTHGLLLLQNLTGEKQDLPRKYTKDPISIR